MDQFIGAAYILSIQLLPIIGVAVMIILIVVLAKIIKLIDKTVSTLDRSHGTLDLIDKSLEKVQVPLDSAVKVSKTVDEVHDATVKAVKDSAAYLRKNRDEIRQKVDRLLKKDRGTDPDDTDDVL